MRWLVVASSLTSKNGYGMLCGSVLNELGRLPGAQWDIVTSDRKGSWLPGRSTLKSEWVASYPRLWFLFVAFDFLALAWAAKGRYDGVLILVEHYAAAGWLFSRWKGIASVIVQCGTYAVKLPQDIPFFRRVLESADRVLPISGYTRMRMEEIGIRARYSVVTLGVDTGKFRPSGSGTKKQEVLFVGNLKARKGIDFLLDAVALAARQVPGIRLKVVGNLDRSSPAFMELETRIAGLGIAVEFTGPLPDAKLMEAYSSARLNALPSKSEGLYFEGFGLIHLEANACGTLSVGTFGSGNEDAIKTGFGTLVRYGDVQALAACIADAMTIEPYPALPTGQLRTWKDVARDYSGILGEVSAGGKASKSPEALNMESAAV
jgi:glycosyltransferase involved in cell wall biosynthesis